MKRLIYSTLLTAVIIGAPLALHASESHPLPPMGQMIDLDTPKYALGQKIFLGKLKLPNPDAKLAEAQTPKLKKIQEMLPRDAQEKTKLPSLAGRLDKKQLAALEYFVQKRYCSK